MVDDPTLGINYIVEECVGTLISFDGNDHSDSVQEVVSSTTTTENLSQNTKYDILIASRIDNFMFNYKNFMFNY